MPPPSPPQLPPSDTHLPRRHALQAPHTRNRVEIPGQLGVLRHLFLEIQPRSFRVDARRQQRREHVTPVGDELPGILRERDGMQPHDAEVDGRRGRRARLELEKGAEEAEIVAELQVRMRWGGGLT